MFKALCKKKQLNYEKQQRIRLIQSRTHPNKLWNLVKYNHLMILKPHAIMPVDLSTIYNHFSTLLYDSSAQPLQFENNRHEANLDCNDLNKEFKYFKN